MIGKNIREIRKKRCLSQSELAKMIGTSQAAISKYEKEEQDPTFKTLQKIAQALGVPLSVLVRDC